MNLDRHIWEGWTPREFINSLEPEFDMIMSNRSWKAPFKSKDELRTWCMENQPYYKHYVPEVFNYFKNKANL